METDREIDMVQLMGAVLQLFFATMSERKRYLRILQRQQRLQKPNFGLTL
jgi:hypothetical protein